MAKRMYLDSPMLLVGPSGVGKSIIIDALVRERGCTNPPTITDRPPRMEDDENGDYLSITRELFNVLYECGALAEAEYLKLHAYGTPHTVMVRGDNRCMLFAADLEAAQMFRAEMPCRITLVLPPDCQALAERLNARKDCGDAQLQLRLQAAKEEIQHLAELADFVVVNDDLHDAVDTVANILDRTARGTDCKVYYRAEEIERICQTFEKPMQTTLSGYPVDEELLRVQKDLDSLFDEVFQEEKPPCAEAENG